MKTLVKLVMEWQEARQEVLLCTTQDVRLDAAYRWKLDRLANAEQALSKAEINIENGKN